MTSIEVFGFGFEGWSWDGLHYFIVALPEPSVLIASVPALCIPFTFT